MENPTKNVRAGSGPDVLLHPVYLDTRMLFNFLGRLDDGVALVKQFRDEDVAQLDNKSTQHSKLHGALSGFFHLIPLSAGVEVGTEKTEQSRRTVVRETSAARTYTEAALFNLLRDRLVSVRELRSVGDLKSLKEGSLIEVSGTISANPLQQLLDFYERIVPYLGERVSRRDQIWRFLNRPLDGQAVEPVVNLAKRQIQSVLRQRDPGELKTLGLISKELEDCPIADLVMVVETSPSGDMKPYAETPQMAAPRVAASTSPPSKRGWGIAVPRFLKWGRRPETGADHSTVATPQVQPPEKRTVEPDDGFRVVLTMSREFLTRQTEEYMLGGRFTAIGKVTMILDAPTDQINLARRATVGVLGRRAVEELLQEFAIDSLGGPAASAVVSRPAIQLLPLAIFV